MWSATTAAVSWSSPRTLILQSQAAVSRLRLALTSDPGEVLMPAVEPEPRAASTPAEAEQAESGSSPRGSPVRPGRPQMDARRRRSRRGCQGQLVSRTCRPRRRDRGARHRRAVDRSSRSWIGEQGTHEVAPRSPAGPADRSGAVRSRLPSRLSARPARRRSRQRTTPTGEHGDDSRHGVAPMEAEPAEKQGDDEPNQGSDAHARDQADRPRVSDWTPTAPGNASRDDIRDDARGDRGGQHNDQPA